jgi:hypothetical protein
MAAKHTRAATVDYVVGILKKDAKVAYDAVVKQAKAAGHHVYPLIMGLAKNKLGLGKKAKRGPGRPRGRGPGRPAGARGPGRPAGQAGSGDIVRALDRMQSDLAAMRDALRHIGRVASRF